MTILHIINRVFLSIAILMLATYGAVAVSHIGIELLFVTSVMPKESKVISYIPGVSIVRGKKKYCHDDILSGKSNQPSPFFVNQKCTTPSHRIQLHSRYLRKYWFTFYSESGAVLSKRSMVVM
jgi:hypothetical protein